MLIALCGVASAGPSKEECVEAHSKGQDARDAGQLALARKLFLSCAQSSCPEIVQGDCARFVDTLEREQPTASFIARDGSGADLPDTAVYVDGVLVATRLDDGKPHDLDPGSHQVKFIAQGHEETVTVVVAASEKGRIVTATFSMINPPKKAGGDLGGPRKPTTVTTHALGSKIALGVGGTALVAGTVITIIGFTQMPGNCSVWSKNCDALLGDPVFRKASDAVGTINLGLAVGVSGLAVVGAGLFWYFKSEHTETNVVATPWVAPGAGGLAVGGAW